MDFQESTIKTYSGLSTEIKPTLAFGTDVPNGSRFREVDTRNIYFYNASDDQWYLIDEYLKSISGASPIIDIRAIDIFERMLTMLKKIEYHLAIATDTTLNDQDMEG